MASNEDGTIKQGPSREVFWANESLKAIMHHGGSSLPAGIRDALNDVAARLDKAVKDGA